MIRELVRVGASRQEISGTAKLPVSPWAGACGTPLLSPAGRGWSPRSCGSQACSCFHRARAGRTISWRGGGRFGPGRGMRRSVPGGVGCGSVDPWALRLVDPPGPRLGLAQGAATREPPLPDVGKAARPHQEASPGCGLRTPRKRALSAQDAGRRASPPRARRGSLPPPRLRQGELPELAPASKRR